MFIKLPYNFDFRLIDEYEKILNNPQINLNKDEVLSIYLPCFREDGCNTRKHMAAGISTWEEYVWHIKYILQYNFVIDILFQGQDLIEDNVIQKYLDLGITHFTVSNDALARRIKKLKPNAYITASIVKLLTPEEIKNNEELEIYNEICLYFWYNREFDIIKELPKKYHYQMLVCSVCDPCCKHCFIHWNLSQPEIDQLHWKCPWGYNPLMVLKSCYLNRDVIEKFLPDTIYSLKLPGREYQTYQIIDSLQGYCDKVHQSLEYKDFNLNNPFPQPYRTLELTSPYFKK